MVVGLLADMVACANLNDFGDGLEELRRRVDVFQDNQHTFRLRLYRHVQAVVGEMGDGPQTAQFNVAHELVVLQDHTLEDFGRGNVDEKDADEGLDDILQIHVLRQHERAAHAVYKQLQTHVALEFVHVRLAQRVHPNVMKQGNPIPDARQKRVLGVVKR